MKTAEQILSECGYKHSEIIMAMERFAKQAFESATELETKTIYSNEFGDKEVALNKYRNFTDYLEAVKAYQPPKNTIFDDLQGAIDTIVNA